MIFITILTYFVLYHKVVTKKNNLDIEVTFLGTGTSQGVPVIACNCEVCISTDQKDSRLRTSAMITIDGNNYVIDTGPDFRQQMLNNNVKSLNAILFTHEHKDHVAGMDDIRAFNFAQKKDMQVYASSQVQKALQREFHYVFAEVKYPGVPQVHLNTINKDEIFNVDGHEFSPIQVMHYKLPVMGFRVGDFTYITDANHIEEDQIEKIKGSKVIVLNALRKKSHISHFNLEGAVELLNYLNPEKAYLTHISHYMGKHKEVSKELPDFIDLAYDGLKIKI